ncbi:MAG: CHASE domain-containing protein [Bacillota bacterium]
MPISHHFKNLEFFKIKPVSILFFGLLASVIVGTILFFHFKQIADAQIEVETKKISSDFDDAFKEFEHPLEGIVSAITLNNFEIDSQKFHEASAARDFYKNFPGALGFGFIRKVNNSQIVDYLAKMRKTRPEFKLKRIGETTNAENEALSAKSNSLNDSLFVIEVVEPIDLNKTAIGLVVSDEKHRKAGALKSVQTGKATATEPIQLVQVAGKEVGFLVFKPIFRSNTKLTTIADREKEIFGWAYAPVLLKSVIAKAEQRNINVHFNKIFLVSNEKSPQLIYQSNQAHFESTGILQTKYIDSMGQKWLLEINCQNSHTWSPLTKSLPIFLLMVTLTLLAYIGLYYSESEKKLYVQHLEKTELDVFNATQEISNQRQFLQKIIDMIPAMIGYWDRDLTNRISNQAYLKFFGKKPEEIFGRSLIEILGEKTYEKNKPFIDGVLNGNPQTFERQLTTTEGQKDTLAQYIPDFNSQGEVIGFFVLVTDVSELKITQRELDQQKALAVQNEKLRSLGAMASGMAHEINNPLAIISGNVQILDKFRDNPEKFKAKSQQIMQSIDRIAKIIDSLRKFSHNSENVIKGVHFADKLVDSVLLLTGAKAKNNDVMVTSEVAANLPILVNEIECEQILVNLITNAIDAVKDNSEKWVKIISQIEKSSVVLQVIDSGFGISPKVEKRLFEPFFTTKPVGEGTGLGLSISKGLAESNGGSLILNQNLRNTCFELRVPIASESVKDNVDDDSANQPGIESNKFPPNKRSKNAV